MTLLGSSLIDFCVLCKVAGQSLDTFTNFYVFVFLFVRGI